MKTNKKPRITRRELTRFMAWHKKFADHVNHPRYRKRARKALRKRKENRSDPRGKEIQIVSPVEHRQICYGRCRVSGNITYAQITENNQYLLLVITIAGHQINAINNVYFDGNELTFPVIPGPTTTAKYLGLVDIDVNYGAVGQTALASLVADSGGAWGASYKQAGCAHVYLKLKYDTIAFADGVPEIAFDIQGKVHENFGGFGAVYSDNPVRCILDYLYSDIGGANWNTLIVDDAINTANETILGDEYCDQLVSLDGGGQEKRYTAGQAVFDTSESMLSVVEKIAASCAGEIINWGSLTYWLDVLPAVWISPTFAITADDIIHSFTVDSVDDREEGVLSVGATFVYPNDNFEETTIPPFPVSETLDYEDISLPTVISQTQAQRLAKIEYKRRLAPIVVTGFFKLRCWKPGPGERVTLTYSRFGWSSKTFRIESSRMALEPGSAGALVWGVWLRLQEDKSTTYDWLSTEQQPKPDGSSPNFPNSNNVLEAVAGLVIQSGAAYNLTQPDGNILRRLYATWTTPSNFFLSIGGYAKFEIKKSTESAYQDAGQANAANGIMYILNVQEGETYDVRVKFIAGGAIDWGDGPYTTVQHTVQLDNTVPPDVTNFIGVDNGATITITWDIVNDPRVTQYQVRYTTTAQPWETAILIGDFVGETAIIADIVGATYYIKAITYSGIESANAATMSLSGSIVTGNPLGLLLALTKD